MRALSQFRPLRQLRSLHLKDGWMQRGQWLVQHLPRAYRQGKMPYIFFFVSVIIAVLMIYAAISPYRHAVALFNGMAAWLVLLLLLVNHGMPLNWGIHMGTGAGALMLLYAVYSAGGVFSPRFSWLLILPLTPFFVISRRAGTFWLATVFVLQVAMAFASYHGLLPSFEMGQVHAVSSWLTFSLISGILMIVPMIYERLHRQALQESLRYQSELEAKRQELEQAMQMREHFIATVSHELRTPMNAILGFNALLLSRVENKPEALKVLNHTRQSAEHLMTVINDILDYSQLQAGRLIIQPENFELRRVVEHAFELFSPRVNSMELDYRLEVDASLPQWVNTDRHRLMQVLVNLLGNALKFTHQGSVVLRVKWALPNVVFEVEDTGIGIAKDRQAKIFQRFSQADGDIHAIYGGNGLGLAISQKLTDLLGGQMGFESELGKGSRFWLRLPLVAVPEQIQQTPSIKPTLITADKAWRFLVADDHPLNRLLVKQVLQNAWPHSQVLEAVDGQKALEVLHTQEVDLVLMDMVMPVLDGIAATVVIRQDVSVSVRRTPVLGLTANVNPQDLERFESAGLNDLMLKPFEPAQLCAKVEALLCQSALSSQSSAA
jgi:signal transduction histidine kinase